MTMKTPDRMDVRYVESLIAQWDSVAKDEVLKPMQNGDLEKAEDGITKLISIDNDILKKIQQLEKELGI